MKEAVLDAAESILDKFVHSTTMPNRLAVINPNPPLRKAQCILYYLQNGGKMLGIINEGLNYVHQTLLEIPVAHEWYKYFVEKAGKPAWECACKVSAFAAPKIKSFYSNHTYVACTLTAVSLLIPAQVILSAQWKKKDE